MPDTPNVILPNLLDDDFAATPEPTPTTQERPRDAQGRFTSDDFARRVAAVDEEGDTNNNQDEHKVEIDLGDGSGKQVFKADTQEDLIEKLSEAQRHATLKIRELNQKLKDNPPPPKRSAKKLDENDMLAVAMELSVDPSTAFKKLFESETGMTLEDFRESQENARQVQLQVEATRAGQQFVMAHPEYVTSQANANRIDTYMAKMGMSYTDSQDIEKAYQDLLSSGLLETKSSNTEQATDHPRIEDKPAAAPQKKAASGLRSRSGSIPQNIPTNSASDVLSPEESRMIEEMSAADAKVFITQKINSLSQKR